MKCFNLSVIASSIFFSSVAFSHSFYTARGISMGGTGVASSNHLESVIYNPAMASLDNDKNFGLMLPTAYVTIDDKEGKVSALSDLIDIYDQNRSLIENEDYADVDVVDLANKLDNKLSVLSTKRPLNAGLGGGVALSIPNRFLSVGLASSAYMDTFVGFDIENVDLGYDSSNLNHVRDRYLNSSVSMKAVGVLDYSIQFSKSFELWDSQFSIGLSPKYQFIQAYSTTQMLDNIEFDDMNELGEGESQFNYDIGVAIKYKRFTFGLVGKDLNQAKINIDSDYYTLNPYYVFGVSYNISSFTIAADVDLNARERFSSTEDDDQKIKIGIEADVYGLADIRAGYAIDMISSSGNVMSAGVALTPFDLFDFGLALTYRDKNSLGVSANLSVNF